MNNDDAAAEMERKLVKDDSDLPTPAPGIFNLPMTKGLVVGGKDSDHRRATAVERTKSAMVKYTEGRKNQARAFFKRVHKSTAKRKVQQAARKRNR